MYNLMILLFFPARISTYFIFNQLQRLRKVQFGAILLLLRQIYDHDQVECLPTIHLCCQLANFPLNAARAKNNRQ